MTNVLITGARGKTGDPLTRSLADRHGVVVRAGSSRPGLITVEGVEPTWFDWDDSTSWTCAHNADAIYLVRPDRGDTPELIEGFLRQVPTTTHVVLVSEWDAHSLGPDSWPMRIENLVTSRGHSWTIVRPGWFMQLLSDDRFFRQAVLADRELRFASHGASLAWIDARDVAEVVEHALLAPDVYAGRILEINGPEPLSAPQTAAILSEGLERTVVHREVSTDEALEGFTGFDRAELRWTYERVQRGGFAGLSDTVEEVTGHRPRTLLAFARDLANQGV
ncbi:Rossmann-fold NAD(P)-binding domain-containing protein [Nocardioides sambongensis]|uniref:nucleoside-diphosphate sugar epimerase n=1 Tax=Nocardioides sambongensis TaxID=2589074 RepID=UPI001128A89E|nr:nucleoside-diphosphate sugar epimerase [Nocardioides sambongensis]